MHGYEQLPQLNNLLSIDEDVTDEHHGYPPFSRPMDVLLDYGLIALDKPAGPTSHEVVAWVKRMLGVESAGHSGTLDPPTTGLLPIGVGEATKALTVLLLGPKEYYAIARLHASVPSSKLHDTMRMFIGDIYQRPPQRSSVKREVRIRRIYELELVEEHGRLLLLRVLCQAGTYVRKLIYDIGEVLGSGASMVELRRTRVSMLDEDDMVRLHDLYDAYMLWREEGREDRLRSMIKPVEYALQHVKAVVVRDSTVDSLCHGAQLAVPGVLRVSRDLRRGDLVGVYTLKGELVALAEAVMSAQEIAEADRGIAFTLKRVIMRPNTYPRAWKSKGKSKEE
ncbi:MAG: RNA-guided pseudouridylation complex pseudouridine synthase subunit Cbf5 [Candidatus Nitrosocaldus sp.]|nr:RNA-guided pseudouridylation complex pseudouridine synthase subunit Cbf5 [Candidatus Nitrosocaldus sp.]MDW7999936.1 RNA-guided pseudouridylation complex pseudouridine synthase subunit Cbf5 [Candidatus Nitrosocaldus sp.]